MPATSFTRGRANRRTAALLRALLPPRALAASAALAAFTSGAGSAHAQELGATHDVVLGVERLFGFYTLSRHQERQNNPDIDTSPSGAGVGFQAPISTLVVPRFAFDFFIAESLSLGGSLGFYSNDYDGDNGNQNSGVLFAPRVGYVVPFNDKWGVWPRGGISYFSTNNPDRRLAALTAEAPFYFMPVPNVGFTGALVLDLGLTGGEDAGNQSYDYNEQLLGLSFGLFARF